MISQFIYFFIICNYFSLIVALIYAQVHLLTTHYAHSCWFQFVNLRFLGFVYSHLDTICKKETLFTIKIYFSVFFIHCYYVMRSLYVTSTKIKLMAYKSRGDYSLKKLKSDSIHSIESEIDTSEMRLWNSFSIFDIQ